MGILFILFHIITAMFVLFSLRTALKLWRTITLILGCIALGCIGVSIFSLVGYKNDEIDAPDGSDVVYSSSFALECTGVSLFTVGLIMFFIGTGREGLDSAAPGQYQQFNEPAAATTGFATQQQPGYASYAGYP